MMQLTTVIRANLRELGRRRAALVTLFALPLAFYLARHEMLGQSTRMLSLGLGWTISALALFTTVGARSLDRRLRVAGYRIAALVVGRILAATLIGLILAGSYFVIVWIDQDLVRPLGVAGMLLLAVLIGAPLGGLVGVLLPRELEGALALLIILATQMIADPEGSLAKMLPFWSIRQLANWAIDGTGSHALTSALVHASATYGGLVAALGLLSLVRLRIHPAPLPQAARGA